MPDPVNYGSLPFEEQIRFFRRKQTVGTRAWTDIWQEQHDHAFVVAGAMRDDLLGDLRDAVDKAISSGTTLAEFRKDFDKIVAMHGWSYKGGRGWRTRVIYETNLRTSHAAGRFSQMQAVRKTRPFWQYRHSDAVDHPRPKHLAWDGLVLRHDNDWWKTNYPPNGWGCKCSVVTLSKRDMDRLGKSGPDKAPPLRMREVTVGKRGPSPRTVQVPDGVDPGWAYAPGRSSWIDALSPVQTEELLPSVGPSGAPGSLPDARSAPSSRVLPDNLSDEEYINRFLSEFGISGTERHALFEDVAGELLLISDALFMDGQGKLKIGKRDRAPYVLLLADTIKLPDEIWVDMAEYGHGVATRRRYVARWKIKGSDIPGLVVFETGPQGWVGKTAFAPEDIRYLDRRARIGNKVWSRK